MMTEERKKELKVLNLINQNSNWEEILSSSPYNIIIKHKNNFTLLKYNQLESDMSNEIVQECRGLILKKELNQYKIASMRFTKFFNYGQPEAAKLEFPAEVSEKIDGSLIGVWYDEDTGWHVSTSGNIDAEDAPLGIGGFQSYRKLFDEAWGNLSFDILDKNYTYMFELISPYARLIVSYKETKLYLLAVRNNLTLEELDRSLLKDYADKIFNGAITTPKSFYCSNIKEVQNIVDSLTDENEHYEGFVICDKHFNRIKLKSAVYANLFFIKGDGVFSEKKILKLILDEQDDDILGYFPEYTDEFNRIRRGLSKLIQNSKDAISDAKQFRNLNKKDFAQQALKSKYADVLFKAYDNQIWDKDEEYYFEFLKSYIDTLYELRFPRLLELVRGEIDE